MLNKLWSKLLGYQKSENKKSIREVGIELDVPKSTIHHEQKKQLARNQYAESEFWETEAGQSFLKRLIVSVIYTFGIKGGIGAGRIEEFMNQIRIGTHVGVSESSIYRMMKEVELSIFRYRELVDRELKKESKEYMEQLEVVLGLDETWLDDMLLVCQELTSGYIFLKMQAQDETPKAGGKK